MVEYQKLNVTQYLCFTNEIIKTDNTCPMSYVKGAKLNCILIYSESKWCQFLPSYKTLGLVEKIKCIWMQYFPIR